MIMCELFRRHSYTVAEVAKKNGLTPTTINASLQNQVEVDIVRFSSKTGKHCGGQPNVSITSVTTGYIKPGLKRPIVYYSS